MRLHVFPTDFLIEPDRGLDGPVLRIDRATAALSRPGREELDALDFSLAHSSFIYGVVGVARLLAGRYLVCITGAEVAARLPGGHVVRRLTAASVIPYALAPAAGLDAGARDDEERYLEMLHAVLGCNGFHFCATWDLTNSLQRLSEPGCEADPRFAWNRFLQRELVDGGFREWATPLVQAFVAAHQVELHGHQVTLAVISRRSCRRAGKRYTTRGLDLDGNAANFAETEQLLYTAGSGGDDSWRVFSYLQTRGSVAVVWRQLVTLKYMPTPEFSSAPEAQAATRRHFDEQLRLYGRQTLVSLVNHKGKELTVEQAYSRAVDSLRNPDLRFVSFDFHKECSKMRYGNLSKLVAQVADEFGAQGYFAGVLASSGAAVACERRQKGVFRTNCMDCLDRTNVVQGLFARRVLEEQLREAGVLGDWQRAPGFGSPEFEHLYKQVWADNADAMSMQYTGTGAQKTDYTRTGKRTKVGAAQDLQKSVSRYVQNNFYDGSYQDALDLFLGRFVPDRARPSPLDALRDAKRPKLSRFAGQVALLLAVALLVWFLAGPAFGVPTPGGRALAWLYFMALPVLVFKLAERRGRSFVVVPLLRDPNPDVYGDPGGSRKKSD